MKISSIHIGKMYVPLLTPFKTALRTVEAVEDIVVIVETETGLRGFGEAPPTAVITGDTHDSIIGALQLIGKQLIGRDLEDFNELIQLVQRGMVKNTSGKAALEIALYDLWAQSFGRPLYRVLGGGVNRLKTDLTISVNPVEKMVADSQHAVNRGFDTLKIKVGKNLDEDLQRLCAIRSAVGADIKLSLDANQGWTLKEALYAVDEIKNYGIRLDFIEQPLEAHDLTGLQMLTAQSLTPILADEAVFTPKDAITVLEMHAADLINIKLMKTGGLSQALSIVNIAAIYNAECMLGCMLEAGISVTAASHLAAARHEVITRIDLDGPALCSENPLVGGISMDGPEIVIPDAPGLGISDVKNFIGICEIH